MRTLTDDRLTTQICFHNPLPFPKRSSKTLQTLISPILKKMSLCPQKETHFLKFFHCDFFSLMILTDAKEVTIGEVSKKITPAKHPQYVPHKYLSMGRLSQTTLRHLRWMLQKDLLGQDIFLIGRPGPTRRRLAMTFLEMTGREIEYISLSRDTTEADLKQRREILGGTARYFDQGAVRAAIEGRVLVLEGIEKAERNVLPVLNNLLENREMHLEDGRFLIPASRYDKLLEEHGKEELDRWHLVRVSDDFRVIALGLPIPKYTGNPLDPPLRSRFQARNISHDSYEEQLSVLKKIAPSVDTAKLNQLLSVSYALLTEDAMNLGLPDFPVDGVAKLGEILRNFPDVDVIDLVNRLYPFNSFLNREGRDAVAHILRTFDVVSGYNKSMKKKVEEVKISTASTTADCVVNNGSSVAKVKVPCGPTTASEPIFQYIPTPYQDNLMTELLQSHSVQDFCLIGPKGCGKSVTLLRLAQILNYEVEPIVLYQDITSRDLIQQRNTLPNGDTIWQNSPLIQAALEGKLAVLDGIDRVHPSTLSVIHRLVQDREVQLYDGKRLIRHDRYDEIKEKNNLKDEDMINSGCLRIHPSFRIAALAESAKQGTTSSKWLSPEMLSLFLFHEMRPLSNSEETHIIQSLYGKTNDKMSKIIKFASFLRTSEDPVLQSLSSSFSTRQLLRIAKRVANYPLDSAYESVQKACLARFLPPMAKRALDDALSTQGIENDTASENADIKSVVTEDEVIIGNTRVARCLTSAKSKVPDILFYDVPQHMALLEWLLQDFSLGEHLLLVGNQGVGKNKIADRLLQLLNKPREYIQLHRDTTVQTLTLQATVKDGKVSYEDSPLVQAVKNGHVLVVDEADKAPTHVTCILKTLVERGEMTLSDGRKIVPAGDKRTNKPNIIPVNPGFRMIVLANRPGFPFLGNDFFGALGDLFSCHAVDNPSPESEIALLKQYGPDVPEQTILKLVRAFGELRTMADKGLVQYPYSTREVVNIVKHLQKFPDEGLTSVVSNVFDFDKYSGNVLETLIPVLHKHGIPINTNIKNISISKEFPMPKISKYGHWDFNFIKKTRLPVEISHLKTSSIKQLEIQESAFDIVEARATVFSEQQYYWTLPLGNNNIVTALTATLGENPMKDLIHVLAINPLRLYTASRMSGKVNIINLEAYLPRMNIQGRFKFTLSPLENQFENCLVLHENSLNKLILIDFVNGSVQYIEPSSDMFEMFKTSTYQRYEAAYKMNSQMANLNQIILHQIRKGKVKVLDLNAMENYSMELPIDIQSLQVVRYDNSKWLVQDVENKKYILEKDSPADPIPSVLVPITESINEEFNLGLFTGGSKFDLDDNILSKATGQKLSAPSRLLLTDDSYATIAVGFPDLDKSTNDLYCWFRQEPRRRHQGLVGKSVILDRSSHQIVTPIDVSLAPRELRDKAFGLIGYLEVVDLNNFTVKYIPIPEGPRKSWYLDANELGLYLCETSEENLVTVDRTGCVRFWETSALQLERSLDEWKKLVGTDREKLQLTIERDSGKDVSSPKHGKVDKDNKPHVGGNTWAGGTGGRDTAGLGGKGGPYRLDAGHDVHQISDAEKEDVPEDVKRAAREMGKRAFQKRLKEIQMSEYDNDLYMQYLNAVQKQVDALRVIIGNLQAKAKERQWARHQTSGDLDDLKLIEGLTGEKTIYRRREEKPPEPGTPQAKPKRLKLVVDVSGSMYRFNGYDGRLERMMEATILVMEAFKGYEAKFQYDIIGHSGEAYNLVFVEASNPPTNNKQRLDIIKTMHAHAQFCLSGDHTLPATVHAIESLAKEDCDEAIVVVLSDANLERYGIRPERFGQVLTSNPDVNAYAIFIGSLGDQAARLTATLPAGRAFVCLDLVEIPQILQQIFTSSMLSSS